MLPKNRLELDELIRTLKEKRLQPGFKQICIWC